MKDMFIGIDPGLKGGVSVIDKKQIYNIEDMPVIKNRMDVNYLYRKFMILKSLHSCIVGIEKLMLRSHDGGVSIQTTAKNYGMLLGVLDLSGVEYIEIPARTWQKAFNYANRKAGANKAQNAQICIDLYPNIKKSLKGPRGGLKDCRCDSLLIATFLFMSHKWE